MVIGSPPGKSAASASEPPPTLPPQAAVERARASPRPVSAHRRVPEFLVMSFSPSRSLLSGGYPCERDHPAVVGASLRRPLHACPNPMQHGLIPCRYELHA